MEANELRVGNYIENLINKSFGIDKILVVSAIFSSRPHAINACPPEIYPDLGSVCEVPIGIPLTEEWLNKLGLDINQWFCENSYCVVEDKTGDTTYGWCMKVQNASRTKEIEFGYFKYVHQLQNLYFALTGEELTINE